jgi:hypothetical protein
MTQLNIYVLEGGASNQVQRIIGQKFFLKSDINFVNQFIYQSELNQSANVNLKSRKRCYFQYTSGLEVCFCGSGPSKAPALLTRSHLTSGYFKVVTLFIRNLFRVRLPYLFLIRGFIPTVFSQYKLCLVRTRWRCIMLFENLL